ncbi:MAG: WD40/YVTN/BNR-like repeat-containing protein, partial [Planctomycetota bacterium]
MLSLRLVTFSLFATFALPAQNSDELWQESRFDGLAFRSIGPALMSGRIADLAIDPRNENTWYVAVGSGGVWKTTNAGVTFTPVFDEESTYSIGCVTIDPHNPHRIWVGTGENVGGRHIAYGDGVFRSDDAGANWTNLGLKNSEHISEIVVHPRDPNTVWVASQGPLWSPGGERGVYKSSDGGSTWRRTLGDDQWVGATDLAIDPRDPDRIYAATWQRHRTVAAYMGGGPGTGLHRSEDGGETWTKLTEGLPEEDMGKIGLAISPQQPDVLYAAIELKRRTGGLWKSMDRGATWQKQSDTVSGGTGPHYYQELYASPHAFDRVYLADVTIQISDDGGKTFRRMKEAYKHGDNHALAFKLSDPDYLLCGSDGGVYESFDLAENWRFMANLPLTQFYKIAIDDAEPFYNVYGGTQDNSTEGGPIRTDNLSGIQNSDWKVILDWDGHQPATEPGNPDIVYAERQEGFLARVDMRTGEVVSIQPQPEAGENYERFNWDSPILVSPHNPTRLYFASQRVWRSDNRGDDWTAISTDLTRNQERIELEIMGSTQSWDAAWDLSAMSTFNTITSLAESPVQEGLLYAGTDDGLIQVSEGGSGAWRAVEIGSLPGVPARAFVNDIRADLFDADTVYLAADNHKEGDYAPYLYVSRDRGHSWESMVGNLPERNLVWRLVQDHVDPQLFFIGTERGVFFSTDAGKRWTRLGGGMPMISVRDLQIHRRENDLVCATFGRGIYVLDDIAPFRSVDETQLTAEATLFDLRDAWWYIPRSVLGFVPGVGQQGASYYAAPNPPFGAVFTYYLSEDLRSAEQDRQHAEKKAKR